MDYETKKKSPYKGVLLVCVIMIILPIIIYFIIYGAFNNFNKGKISDYEMRITSFIFATGIGLLFHLSFAVSGAFKESRMVVKERVAEFKENLLLSLWFAIQSYLYDMRKNGIVYLIYVAIIFINALLCVLGLREYFIKFL